MTDLKKDEAERKHFVPGLEVATPTRFQKEVLAGWNGVDTIGFTGTTFHIFITRKYPLRVYILGVLTHTTTWDQHWGGDETLK